MSSGAGTGSGPGPPLLAVDDIHIRFGGIKAADGVTLDVVEGETLAIIGPNGAGKTTFINICTGYLKPQRGDIQFDGRSIRRLPPRGITRIGIARSFQIPQLFLDHTVRENLLLAVAARDREWRPWRVLDRIGGAGEVLELLDLFGLSDTADREIGTLPEGSRKLIDIALALALRPRLLLMDEPTSGVASSEKFAVMDALRHALAARSVTAVFVEHDMEVVERYASRVAVWNQGRILALGATRDILQDPDVLREVTGVEHAPVA